MKAKYVNPFTDLFHQAFEKAELAKMGESELVNYENSLKFTEI